MLAVVLNASQTKYHQMLSMATIQSNRQYGIIFEVIIFECWIEKCLICHFKYLNYFKIGHRNLNNQSRNYGQ